MARMILHIGPPKTATTTLQELVFPKLTGVCYFGKPWWNPGIPYDKCVAMHQAIDSVTKAASGAYDDAAARKAVDEWLEHAPDAQPQSDGSLLPRLLSEERLMLTDVVSLEEIAERLARLFPEAELVLVRRDPVAGLRSYHRWLYARAWIDEGFSDWLEQGMKPVPEGTAAIGLQYYDWPEIARVFGCHFPVVRFAEFDTMLSDTKGFLETFFGFASEEFGQFEWLKERRLNESRNRAVSELHRSAKKTIRLWNRLPFGKIDEKTEYLGESRLWRLMEAPFRRMRLGEGKLAISEADKQRIRGYYASRAALPGQSNGAMSASMAKVSDVGKSGR